MNPLNLIPNRIWHRERNKNNAYLEDINPVIAKVNEIIAAPGTSTVLGYYATLAALTTAHPTGTAGQFAIVGNTLYIWDTLTSAWITLSDTLYKGVLDASTNYPLSIPYPTAQIGEFWFISIAGTIGTTKVEAGDQVICIEAYAGGMDDTKFMIVQSNSQVTQVTHTELLNLISNGLLENGRKYQIWDFVQAYNIFDGGTNTIIEQQAGVAEALIVTATGSNTLEATAYSPAYPQDIIYYDPNPTYLNTDIGYSDGAGTLLPQLKGVITYRHDTKQNVSTWYDFRNIKFRRWAVDAVAYDGGTAYVAKDVCKGSDGKIYKCISDVIAGQGDPSTNTTNWILWNDITADAYISWTADSSKFAIGGITPTNLIFDTATYQDVYTFGDWYQHVNSVTIGKNDLAIVMAYGYNSTLNNIVFKTTDNFITCFSNEIGEISYNNTIGSGFYYNSIGENFKYNTIGTDFSSNTIESNFNSNNIGGDFKYNTIGNDFNRNTIESGFYRNTIGSNFSSNTIGGYFYSNSIGCYFDNNTIGSDFSYNTIGNNSIVSAGINCQGNSIGDYNTQVTLGDNCTGISIGEKNDAITLGASCTNLTFQNGCAFNTNTAATGLQNCLFESGTSITGVDFTLATHIKATYNKRVFTNASSVVRLSYFNASDTLTVVNVND